MNIGLTYYVNNIGVYSSRIDKLFLIIIIRLKNSFYIVSMLFLIIILT